MIAHEESIPSLDLQVGDVINKFRLAPTSSNSFHLQFKDRLEASPVIDIPKTSQYKDLVPVLREILQEVTVVVDELAAAGLS